jgi:hypothetical protein
MAHRALIPPRHDAEKAVSKLKKNTLVGIVKYISLRKYPDKCSASRKISLV